MDVVDEEGRLSRESKDLQIAAVSRHQSLKGKEKELFDNPASRKSFFKTSKSALNRKHGSFDFERPGLGAIVLQRSPSNGTSTTVTSGWSRSGETLPVRESALGPGLAGVGTMQKDTSVKRGKEREEMAKEFEKQARAKKNVVMEDSEPRPPQMNSLPALSSNGQQTPFSTTTLGKSPSFTRASARRIFQSGSRNITQHGLLPFESPITSLARSTAAAGAAKEVSEPWDRRTGQGKEQEKERLVLKIKDQPTERKGSQSPKRSQLPVSTSKYTTLAANVVSGVKGRSLDLNLGLSWAPSRVREDVLLKSSSLFNRTINASSSSRSLSSSAHDNGTTGSKSDDMASAKLRLGREIGEEFKEVLGKARYIRFKMCKFYFFRL